MSRARAWVIIDWRNLCGQLLEAQLPETLPSEAALAATLDGYGMTVAGVSLGIGVCPDAAGSLKLIHDENQRLVREAQGRGWNVLTGLLRHEEGGLREKMTDSRCVLEAARLVYERPDGVECVVIMSRDMDMVPASDLGHARSFPVFLASSSAHDPRPAPRLHLPLPVMRILAGRDPLAGEGFTVTQTEFLRDEGPHEWVVEAVQSIHKLNGWRLVHESGSVGFLDAAVGAAPALGERLTLVSSDVHFDEFDRPVAWCTASLETPERDWLAEARVIRRRDASKVDVAVGSREIAMRCAVGQAEPGQHVLVRLHRPNDHLKQQANARLVGPLDPLPARSRLAGHLQVGRPVPVKIVSNPPGSLAQGVDEHEARYGVAASDFAPQLRPGSWYACVRRAVRIRGDKSAPPILDVVSGELPL